MKARDTDAHRLYRLLVVAVETTEKQLFFILEADYVFLANDTVLLMDHSDDIKRFRDKFNL